MEAAPDAEAEMPLTTIDSKGDIVLEVGKERLLVSSKALTLASPVFEAMFKPTFKEGIQSHQNSCDPSIIPLPEDDAEAFILLCKVVHHRPHEIPQEPGIPCLENLAFICDKYQCSAAVAYHGIVWLQRLLRDAGPKDLDRLLLLAYVLDLPDCFSNISWEILQTHTGQFVDLPLLADHPLIRHDFLLEFNKRKTQLAQSLQEAIMRPASLAIEIPCPTYLKAAGEYLNNLKRTGILPYEGKFRQRSFRSVISSAPTFPKQRVDRCWEARCVYTSHIGQINFKKQLRQELEKIREVQIGVCLDCVKTAQQSKAEGRCRLSHQ